jgi:NTP pyrophosphatase (non-canonical NTP hydrolase)
MLNFNELRDQVQEWSDRNFGSTMKEPRPHRPFLGMVEEAGELIEALEAYKEAKEQGRVDVAVSALVSVADAIADMLIFGADYASRKAWDYEKIATSEKIDEGVPPLDDCLKNISKQLGVMAHSHLKSEQGIRGDSKKHDLTAQTAFGHLMVELQLICRRFEWDLRHVVEEVWARVRLRDFTQNKLTGEAPVKSSVRTCPCGAPIYRGEICSCGRDYDGSTD